MALLPLSGHTGAIQCHLLPFQLPRTRLGYAATPRKDTGVVFTAQVLLVAWLCWPGQLEFQHDLSYERLPSHRKIGLFRSRGKRFVRSVLRTDTCFQTGEERA